MTKKIFRSIFIVAMVVFLACLGIIMLVMYDYFSSVQKDKLADETDLAVRGVIMGGMDYLESVQSEHYRLTWIDKDGTVLFDIEADAAKMENHDSREEVQEARLIGVGGKRALFHHPGDEDPLPRRCHGGRYASSHFRDPVYGFVTAPRYAPSVPHRVPDRPCPVSGSGS